MRVLYLIDRKESLPVDETFFLVDRKEVLPVMGAGATTPKPTQA
jgi:hypothetical protein